MNWKTALFFAGGAVLGLSLAAMLAYQKGTPTLSSI